MNWFENQRMGWIAESVAIFGFINRKHIQLKFGISTPQASSDLKMFQKLNPDIIEYNPRKKYYERVKL